MGVSNYVLFTTPSCVSCVPVKDYLKELGLKGVVVDASEGDGRRLAVENNVRSVPVVYFYDENSNEVGLARSVNEIKSLMVNESVSSPSKDPLGEAVKVYNKNVSDDKVVVGSSQQVLEEKPKVEKEVGEVFDKVVDVDGVTVNFKQLDGSLPLPEYKTEGSVGLDLYARETVTFAPRSFGLVPCNIIVKVPKGFMLGVFSRSSTAFRKGLLPANGVGVVDQDYCGEDDEIKAPLFNPSDVSVVVEKGERISQLVFIRADRVNLKKVDSMSDSSRGGFGSTG